MALTVISSMLSGEILRREKKKRNSASCNEKEMSVSDRILDICLAILW